MSEFMQRPSRPAQRSNTEKQAAGKQTSSKQARFNGGSMQIGIGILLIAGAFLGLATIAMLIMQGSPLDRENDRISEDKYQAVFLDSQDGQVYFGKLKAVDGDNYRLQDIYYVQVQTAQTETGQQQTTGISLAQLGSELHAPESEMFIQKNQVLFWENLKDEGQVVCAIRDHQISEGASVTKHSDCPDDTPDVSQQQQQNANQNGAAAGTQPAGTAQQNDTPGTTPQTP